MNPISKKIINKLSQQDKTELKSEKVELALDSDAKSALNKINKYIDILDSSENKLNKLDSEYDSLRKSYNNLRADVISSRNFLRKSEKDIKDIMSKYELAAKDLGIKVNSIKEYKSLQEGLNLTSVYIDGAERDLKPITKKLQQLK